MMYASQISMLYNFNLSSPLCQLFSVKLEEKKAQITAKKNLNRSALGRETIIGDMTNI